jgi:hypothetical protein
MVRRIASTSISTSKSGEMSADTLDQRAAGRMSPNTLPCARATSSQREMSVMNVRTRTTS